MMNDSKRRNKGPYALSFEKKVKKARSDKAKGELIPVNPENVWESIESGSKQDSIKAIWFQDDRIFIRTASGEERGMPLQWFPKLYNASQAERERFEISPFGIHWPGLDEDLSFEGFLLIRRKQVKEWPTLPSVAANEGLLRNNWLLG